MKKHLILAAMASAVMFTACSNEDDNLKNENEGKKVTFVIGGVNSRTLTTGSLGEYTTVFNTNDAVGIYATNVQGTVSNSQYTVTENNTLSGDEITYIEGETPTFTAYYPFASEGSTTTEASGVVTMTVADQSEGIDKFDLMSATGELGENGETVSFNFAHKLAMIEVQVVGNNSTSVSSMTLNNIKPTVTWTAATNNTSEAGGTATDINMYKLPNITENVYVALVPVQTIEANSKLFTTQIDRTVYTFTTSNQVELTANNIKRYKITIGEAEQEPTLIEVSNLGLEIVGWAKQMDVTDDLTKKEETIITRLISASEFAAATMASGVSGLNQMKATGWAQVGSTDNATITLNTGTLTLKAPSTASSSWFNRGIVFRSNNISETTKYTLKFKVKCDNENGGAIQLSIMQPEASSNTWFQLGTTTNHNYINDVTNTEKEYSLLVDLSISNPTNADYSNGILLYIAPKTNDDITYTITNLTLEETIE